ncbi:uncharacterized protein YDR132C [Aspergillus lentulus]|uniref:Uncharacterized protein YDR132C n=1 Tax=Aspergillus lentulus TaxID=293939 RepID=A0ABQ1A8T7_ASPLE|nr:uncharacterized protein YDR132C [Aspergillus lentulus]GFF31975.1 uncharacterized protein YDR132C [Aspergillus lentulus]GFF58548.1 uncharacterized protein YDR132C [Aspergillus lentulus]GFF76212.1 uncharacterized protein YDR132C [Aspergillus lentulus]GFF78739.1 uncharacterized protein YDR132C [Aspergillus lentulus]GFG04030.1 uncharacterized protein YDR132C [Aspergillus lentulus]
MASTDSDSQRCSPATKVKSTLPPEKVFSIQIGTELFRLSGASIASDAPSYFSQFFEEQLRQNGENATIRTLYIDRDPETFREIARHLQGYHVEPKDESQFVKLFADAQFYTLPRLISQLFESQIFIQIGERHFQISRDIFSGPGDSPNFFSLGFAIFFANPSEIFPGLDRHGLLRPPAIVPPRVTHRSGDVFAQLLHLLRGYPLQINNEEHRAELLRDCRYFHLRGLEQKLIPHHISFNPIRQRSEIVIRLDDVRPSGIRHARDDNSRDTGSTTRDRVTYARPFVDETPHDLILEIGDESTILDARAMRAGFLNLAKARMSSLAQIIAKSVGLEGPLYRTGESAHSSTGGDSFSIRFERETELILNGQTVDRLDFPSGTAESSERPPAKRKRVEEDLESGSLVVRKGQWRLVVESGLAASAELVLIAVKLDVYTEERVRNRSREFLGS